MLGGLPSRAEVLHLKCPVLQCLLLQLQGPVVGICVCNVNCSLGKKIAIFDTTVLFICTWPFPSCLPFPLPYFLMGFSLGSGSMFVCFFPFSPAMGVSVAPSSVLGC